VSAATAILRVSKRVCRRGLVLLRFVVALNAAAEGISILSYPDHEAASCRCLGGLAVVSGVSILMGFLTPISCGLAAVGNVFINFVRLPSSQTPALASSIPHLDLAIICVALVLLGPGAFSLDARLFGRREILLPDPKQDQPYCRTSPNSPR
jgi:uncharacterized membrane protein YphA (DoxX/SURF4 family)